MSERYKTIIANFGYLSVLQVVSLALPLLTYPYLIRVLGAEIYGKVIFAQAIMAYFSIIINYGFNIYGTKIIAENSHNREKISEIVSSIFSAKVLLWGGCLVLLLLALYLLKGEKEDLLLYLLSFGICFNELFFQQYFFQGIEKMKYITIINIIPKLLFFLFIFLIIKKPEDYLYVPFLNSIGALMGGFLALWVIVRVEKISISKVSFSKTLNILKESSPFFLSRFSSVVINKTNTVLLGSFVGYSEVSFYDLAQKIMSVLLIPFDILNQVTYPYIAKTLNMKFVRRLLKYILGGAITLYLLLFTFGKYLVLLLGGENMVKALPIVLFLCINIFITPQTYFLGNTVLVVKGRAKEFNLSVVFTSICYLLFNLALIGTGAISIYTIVLTAVMSELFCFLFRFYYTRKYKLL